MVEPHANEQSANLPREGEKQSEIAHRNLHEIRAERERERRERGENKESKGQWRDELKGSGPVAKPSSPPSSPVPLLPGKMRSPLPRSAGLAPASPNRRRYQKQATSRCRPYRWSTTYGSQRTLARINPPFKSKIHRSRVQAGGIASPSPFAHGDGQIGAQFFFCWAHLVSLSMMMVFAASGWKRCNTCHVDCWHQSTCGATCLCMSGYAHALHTSSIDTLGTVVLCKWGK